MAIPRRGYGFCRRQIFLNSARRAQPGFEVMEDNLSQITEICGLVQGMPLGIVLAASWLAMLSPEEIVAEIKTSIDFLEDEMGEVPERQRSLRAVFEYSWQQMTASEQNVFMKISVFRRGFTREAAQAIAGASLRDLLSLVNKSMIRRDSTTGRYEIHELLRQYAEEQSTAAGILDTVRDDHCSYFADYLDERDTRVFTALNYHDIEDIDIEMDNIRVAWTWACDPRIFQADQQNVTHIGDRPYDTQP